MALNSSWDGFWKNAKSAIIEHQRFFEIIIFKFSKVSRFCRHDIATIDTEVIFPFLVIVVKVNGVYLISDDVCKS